MRCPACAAENPAHAKFCLECGTRFQVGCVACGAALPPEARFCLECGAAVTSSEAAPPRSTLLPASFANGRYTVARFLGEGGKKKVYLTHDTLLDRDVAFSLIKTEGLDDAGVERIRREARLMGRLGGHLHIVSLYDMGDEAGQPYLVSELMAGGDVEGLIATAPDHRLPLADTLRIADQVCQALAYAHEQGIIHRDLKPGNVWLTYDGTAKLGDFGLAMAIDKTRLSIAGMIVGTVGYMPPEQAMGRAPDARSDLYSLGAMLYEMVTGRPPFLGDDPVAIISQHVNTAPVAPSWHNPRIPKPLETLILRLLEKDPGRRPESAEAARRELATIAAIVPAVTPSTSEQLHEPEVNPLDRLAGGVFVGREAEGATLRAGLDSALSGQPRVLLLVGEPGIGKTRLAEELATYAGMRGAQVLWGRCYEWEGAPAYWPWVQVIRSYVHGRDLQALRSELGQGAAEIAQVVSEIRERLPGLPELPAMEPEQARFRLFDSITTFLANASRQQPLVLVLDDLHWADKPSLLLLEFLTRELRAARVLLVATYRDVEVGRHHPLAQTLAELSRSGSSRRIALRGLALEDVRRFIALTAGIEPPDALVAAVHQETEGNPFFMAEVVRLLAAEGRLERPASGASWSVSLPESVREVIGLRLNRLSEACNQTLTVASVVGREFRLSTLERVTGRPADELLDLLEEAVQARVIQEQDAVGHYRFSHALVQETLYAELSTARRARLHGQIGDAIEQAQAANLTPYLGELAQHYFQAAPAGTTEKAIEYGVKAAQWSEQQVAWESAVEHYRSALQLLDLIQPPDEQQRCKLLLALGTAQWRSGDAAAGIATHHEATEAARRIGSTDLFARAALGASGADIIGYIFEDARTVALLREALAGTPPGDNILRVSLLARLAIMTHGTPDAVAERDRLSAEALEMSRRIGDPQAILIALNARVIATCGPDEVELHPPIVSEHLALAERLQDRTGVMLSHYGLAMVALASGDLATFDDRMSVIDRLSRETRRPADIFRVLRTQTVRALLTGQFSKAERLAGDAFDVGQRAWRRQEAWAAVEHHIFTLRREQGRLSDFRDELVAIRTSDSAVEHVALVPRLALLHWELGEVAEAYAIIEDIDQNT